MTGADLLKELYQIRDKQGEALVKLTEIGATVTSDHAQLIDHEGRIRALERFQWKAVGMATAIASVAGAAAGWLTAAGLHTGR